MVRSWCFGFVRGICMGLARSFMEETIHGAFVEVYALRWCYDGASIEAYAFPWAFYVTFVVFCPWCFQGGLRCSH